MFQVFAKSQAGKWFLLASFLYRGHAWAFTGRQYWFKQQVPAAPVQAVAVAPAQAPAPAASPVPVKKSRKASIRSAAAKAAKKVAQ